MSELLTPFDAIAMMPGWDPESTDVEELKGGLTNRTYYVRLGERECVLRLDSARSSAVQFDRSRELEILTKAAKAGLSPSIIFSDVIVGVLVTEFIPGRVWEDSDLESTANLEALAELLRSVHQLPECGFRIDMPDVARAYEKHLEERHGFHAFASKCVEIITKVPVHERAVCCHNDIVAANIVGDSTLCLIDWEFACDNDPLFDLASAIGYHNLDDTRSAILLNAYVGGASPDLKERLQEQVRVYDAIQWLWLASRHVLSPTRRQARRLEDLQQRIA